MEVSPIAFFTYKRPEHTRQSLESLAQNEWADQSELFIFCDGPKNTEDEKNVKQVREVVRSKQWCKNVHIIERESNMGCANSIISGVTEVCEKYGRIIVLEDDLLLSPFFLDYMNKALNLYKDYPEIMQISGHMYPVELDVKTDAIFLPFITAWGWATWQRSWKNFDHKMAGYKILETDKNLRYIFDFNGSYPFFKMLQSEIRTNLDTWDVRWYLTIFILRGLTLHPVQSLVKNIGFDGSGTHCQKQKINSVYYKDQINNFPLAPVENEQAKSIIFNYLKQAEKRNLNDVLNKIVNKTLLLLNS
ncbi:MAG: hypothetical protein V7L31_28735 [Nostoc sp.]|uniref:hypothetical protein n=1 Tax=Nostoc sp. TaxID=1180 RepID=UPI002FF1D78B